MPQRVLPVELEALLAALMADAPPAETHAAADRLEAALSDAGQVEAGVGHDIGSAIQLVRNGQPCAAVSALLAARAALTSAGT